MEARKRITNLGIVNSTLQDTSGVRIECDPKQGCHEIEDSGDSS